LKVQMLSLKEKMGEEWRALARVSLVGVIECGWIYFRRCVGVNESGEVGVLISRILCLSDVSSNHFRASYTYLLKFYVSHGSYFCHGLDGCILGPSISLSCLVPARGLFPEVPGPETYFCRVVDVLLKVQPF
jgi:hypothetical protein